MSALDHEAPTFGKFVADILTVPKVLAAPMRSPSPVEAPFGEGRPVVVIPGLLSNDAATALLRSSLQAAGLDARGWGQGLNAKVTEEKVVGVERHIEQIASETGKPVIVIGWSLGGLFARLLAHRSPQNLDLVVTLGSPFSGDPRANNAWRLYEAFNDHSVDSPPFEHDFADKPPVRSVAIWSTRDGIIAPASARGERDQSDLRIELPYRHMELAASRRAIGELIGVLRVELTDGAPSALAVAQLPALTDEEIARRLPVWCALSDTFLDTELDEDNYFNIAELIAEAGYSKQELETIYRAEVEPAFSYNLLNPAGEWSGWPPEIVHERVLASRKSSSAQARPYVVVPGHVKSEWGKISRALDAL